MGPYFIRKLYELKIGQSIRKDECPLLGKLHEKKQNTPTMGGILILFSMAVSLLLWMDFTHVFTLILLVTTIYLGFLGGRDDYLKLKYKNTKGMSAKGKLFFQILLSCIIAVYFLWTPASQWISHGVGLSLLLSKKTLCQRDVKASSLACILPRIFHSARICLADLYSFFKEPVLIFGGFSLLFMAFFYFFVITGSSNAANLTDGLDGLAAGSLIMVAGALWQSLLLYPITLILPAI